MGLSLWRRISERAAEAIRAAATLVLSNGPAEREYDACGAGRSVRARGLNDLCKRHHTIGCDRTEAEANAGYRYRSSIYAAADDARRRISQLLQTVRRLRNLWTAHRHVSMRSADA